MSDDLSDEACAQWMREINMPEFAVNTLITWRECRRRAEAKIEAREREAFRFALEWMFEIGEPVTFEELEDGWKSYQNSRKAKPK
jgi:hypothetical protein